MSNLETITVSVDSSFKDGYGACAYYIKHEKFVVKDSKYLGKVPGSVDAEFQGIVTALVRCINETSRRVIKKIYVTCDCIPAINLAKKDERIKKLIGDREIIYQHIDAHSGVNSPRQYINNWCDVTAGNCLIENLNKLLK
jgi:hypothetical protein